MSRATSFAGVFQQLAQSLGVGISALVVRWVLALRHEDALRAADITPGFVAIAVLSLAALFFLVPLAPDAGGEVSRHRRR
jgi:hypothetical protein